MVYRHSVWMGVPNGVHLVLKQDALFVVISVGHSWQSTGAELKAKGVMSFSPIGEIYGSMNLRDAVAAAFT